MQPFGESTYRSRSFICPKAPAAVRAELSKLLRQQEPDHADHIRQRHAQDRHAQVAKAARRHRVPSATKALETVTNVPMPREALKSKEIKEDVTFTAIAAAVAAGWGTDDTDDDAE